MPYTYNTTRFFCIVFAASSIDSRVRPEQLCNHHILHFRNQAQQQSCLHASVSSKLAWSRSYRRHWYEPSSQAAAVSGTTGLSPCWIKATGYQCSNAMRMISEHKAPSAVLGLKMGYCHACNIFAAGLLHAQKTTICCHAQLAPQAQQHGPDISLLKPILQNQWDYAANAYMGNIVIRPYSKWKAWWICDQCPDGHAHQWNAIVQNRTAGNGCPQCTCRRLCHHNSLARKAPWAAAQWDYEANEGTPDTVTCKSGQPVGWLCQICSHRWTVSPKSRVPRKTGCPQCTLGPRGARHRHPTFAESQDPRLAQWDHQRNAAHGNYPNNTSLQSPKLIFWLCSKCPARQQHSWSPSPNHYAQTFAGCPFCAGRVVCQCNSLQTCYPDIAAEQDYSKSTGRPSDYVASSHYLAWWFTTQRGTWQHKIFYRTRSGTNRKAWQWLDLPQRPIADLY